jgi:hypothetical protein
VKRSKKKANQTAGKHIFRRNIKKGKKRTERKMRRPFIYKSLFWRNKAEGNPFMADAAVR